MHGPQSSRMNLILPVAGRGLRLHPLTLDRPKPLVPLAGDTLLGQVLRGIEAEIRLDRVVFVIGHLGEQIVDWVRTERPDLDAHFVTQAELRGQAQALWLAREFLAGPILIVFADTIFDIDLTALERLDPTVDGVVHLMPIEDPRQHGVAVLRADGTVERFVEKPATTEHKLTLVGVYFVRDGAWLAAAIDRLIAAGHATRGEYYLADALQIMLDEGARFIAHPVQAWEDCGTLEGLASAERYLMHRQSGT